MPLPEWISGNVMIRPNPLPNVGDRVDGHQHNFDHTTIVFSGAVFVRARKVFESYACDVCFTLWEQRRGDVKCQCGKNSPALIPTSSREEILNAGEFIAPSHFLVKAGVEHEITATRPGTVFWCVYSHRDPQGRISAAYDGWTPAYR